MWTSFRSHFWGDLVTPVTPVVTALETHIEISIRVLGHLNVGFALILLKVPLFESSCRGM